MDPSPTPTESFAPQPNRGGAELLDYPFPLRPDAVVLLRNIPRDLTVAEAERIGAMLRAVAGGGGNDGAKP